VVSEPAIDEVINHESTRSNDCMIPNTGGIRANKVLSVDQFPIPVYILSVNIIMHILLHVLCLECFLLCRVTESIVRNDYPKRTIRPAIPSQDSYRCRHKKLTTAFNLSLKNRRTNVYLSNKFHWTLLTLNHVGGTGHIASIPNDANEMENDETTTISLNDAIALRHRAAELRQEVLNLELALEESKLRKHNKTMSDIQSWINTLFVPRAIIEQEQSKLVLPNANTVAIILQNERFSEEQVLILMKALYQRRNAASVQFTFVSGNVNGLSSDNWITNRTSIIANQTEVDLLEQYMQTLIDAAAILDQSDENNPSRKGWSGSLTSQIQSLLKELSRNDEIFVRRQVDMKVIQSRMKNDNASSTTFNSLQDGFKPNDIVGERVKFIPRWIPPSLLNTIVASKETELDPLDVLAIKERVLTKTRFFCTSSDSFLNAAIFRGNMRISHGSIQGTDNDPQKLPALVFDEIQSMLIREGLGDKIQLFLLNDPEWQPNADSREPRPKPVVVALPKSVTPYENNVVVSRRIKLVKDIAPILSVCTALMFSIGCYALNPLVFDGLFHRNDISVLKQCITLTALIFVVQGIHETAHTIVARRLGIITKSPLLIPSLELGTFGCIRRIMSFPPTRSALFDFAISGPLASSFMSMLLMIIGCYKTLRATNAILLTYPTIPLATLKSSFLSGSILTCFLPKVMLMPQSQPIPIHPCFLAGYVSLIVSALNLLPIFRIDGGRACFAVVGTRFGALISAWTMLTLLSFGISGSGLAWAWGAFIIIFQRQPEIAFRNEVSSVGLFRTIIWGTLLAITVLALLPFPGGVFL
jgi:hypothetical protein